MRATKLQAEFVQEPRFDYAWVTRPVRRIHGEPPNNCVDNVGHR